MAEQSVCSLVSKAANQRRSGGRACGARAGNEGGKEEKKRNKERGAKKEKQSTYPLTSVLEGGEVARKRGGRDGGGGDGFQLFQLLKHFQPS
jgi:hypothetical protein